MHPMKFKIHYIAGFLLLLSLSDAFAAVHYVDANGASPVPPYASWANAATAIQNAVDVAVAGDEIVVTTEPTPTGGKAVFGTMTKSGGRNQCADGS